MRAAARSLLLLPLAACTGEPATRENPVTTRDSAGVAIVETVAAAWRDSAEAWRVDTAATVTIGAQEGDASYLLDRVVGATRLADGTIVAADGGSNQLRFFDPSGSFVRAAGGAGGGPGEFEYLRALQRCGGADSLYAFDINWQMKVFTAAGGYVRQLHIRPPGQPSPYQLACSRNGTFVVTGWGDMTDPTNGPRLGFYRSMTPLWIVDGAGREVASLGELLGSERIGTTGGSRPHPFGRGTVLAMGPEEIYLGDGTRFEVRRHDGAGRLTRIQRAPAEDLAITPAMLEAYRAGRLASASEARRPQLRRELDEMPLPEGLPAFTQLLLDADGNLWAKRFRAPRDSTAARWGVFAPDGAFLGHVMMPPRFELHEVGTSYVLGVAPDDADVQRVRLHPLRRGTAPR